MLTALCVGCIKIWRTLYHGFGKCGVDRQNLKMKELLTSGVFVAGSSWFAAATGFPWGSILNLPTLARQSGI